MPRIAHLSQRERMLIVPCSLEVTLSRWERRTRSASEG